MRDAEAPRGAVVLARLGVGSGAFRPRLRRTARGVSVALVAAASVACAPRAAPITGVAPAAGVRLPATTLPPGHRRISFQWTLRDPAFTARGDGAARLAAPDSARVDLFLAGGFGAAAAILVGDSVRVPPRSTGAELVPPPPMLWAALGRLALPAVTDTVLRVAGDTLRATLGQPVRWRVEVVRDTLRRLERIEDGRIAEWVERGAGGSVRYELAGQRALTLRIEQDVPSSPFDASVWRF